VSSGSGSTGRGGGGVCDLMRLLREGDSGAETVLWAAACRACNVLDSSMADSSWLESGVRCWKSLPMTEDGCGKLDRLSLSSEGVASPRA
jgi:hypothetical protein